jgi:hypothetical protein
MKKIIQIALTLALPISLLIGISQTPEAAGAALIPLCAIIAPIIYSIARGKERTGMVIFLVLFAWIPIAGWFLYGYAWYEAIKSPSQEPTQKIKSSKVESFLEPYGKIVPELNLSSSYVPPVKTPAAVVAPVKKPAVENYYY